MPKNLTDTLNSVGFIQNCELISLYYINFLNDYVNIVDLDAATKIKANYKIAIDSFYIGAAFHKGHEQIQYLSGLQPLEIFTF